MVRDHVPKRSHRVVRGMPFSMAESAGLLSPKPATVEEIRSRLGPDSTQLECFQIRDQLMVALLSHNSLEIVPVAAASEVSDLIARLQFQFSKFRMGPEYIREFSKSLVETTQQHLKQLYDGLIVFGIGESRMIVVPLPENTLDLS